LDDLPCVALLPCAELPCDWPERAMVLLDRIRVTAL
jgi:hypothetical protein